MCRAILAKRRTGVALQNILMKVHARFLQLPKQLRFPQTAAGRLWRGRRPLRMASLVLSEAAGKT